MMGLVPDDLLAVRIFISCFGVIGNLTLIISISQNKLSRVKTFEFFLLGLAASNLEEIIVVNIFDVSILKNSSAMFGTWSCRSLKFLTVFGEINSILFTVLISIFRYQKVRDATKRVNLPIYLDNIRSAWLVSGVCLMISSLLSIPILVINVQGPATNFTTNKTSCPPDFFLCSKAYCPIQNRVYKYMFIAFCNLLPMIIVTITGCLIITVLLSQKKMVSPVVSVSGSRSFFQKTKGPKLNRSTTAVLAAMGLFQVDWTLYLIFQMVTTNSSTESSVWDEVKFFIATSYTSISPYVYGIGNNLFSPRTCIKR
ncbi:uncharacterized protein ora6 [Sphaeramia orbicularis]|uniref:uncharacterized protein ora6 n=1 Tax=Sphaeramia orbicularis TaxID=375764 RepID=UPI0011801AF1|nr:uncharacterized protein LOC115415353 [Sphaeramia orbicularis]